MQTNLAFLPFRLIFKYSVNLVIFDFLEESLIRGKNSVLEGGVSNSLLFPKKSVYWKCILDYSVIATSADIQYQFV